MASTAFRSEGEGASPVAVTRAIDGNPQTHTTLGTTTDQENRLAMASLESGDAKAAF